MYDKCNPCVSEGGPSNARGVRVPTQDYPPASTQLRQWPTSTLQGNGLAVRHYSQPVISCRAIHTQHAHRVAAQKTKKTWQIHCM